MNKIIGSLLISLLALPTFAVSFSDTELSYYRDSIETLATEGIISGYGDGRFGPENTITRAELLKILFGSKGVAPAKGGEKCFPDVAVTRWYHPYICEGWKLGIVKGFDDGKFKPDNPVTVLEVLAMGLRLYGLAPQGGNPWYLPYQDFAGTSGILDTASYSIITPMTRGKASELILRIREYSTMKSPLKYLSKGCTNPKSLTSGTHTMTIADKNRSYILTVPGSYTSSNPAKLIIAIHGRTNNNTMVRDYMGLEGGDWSGPRQTDFIVAYPAGLPNGSAYSWSSEEDITFIDTIIRDITDSHCVDRGSVHVVAHSLGAWLASRLACTRGDTFRSLAIVGGGGYTSSCGATPTATLIFQRPDDRLSSPATARTTERVMKGANMCNNQTTSVQIGGYTCQKWSDCSTGNPVIWCEDYSTLGGDPHSWPTGGGTAILGWMRGL